MNEALKRCRDWAITYGLDISPQKTNYMLFTNKQKKSYAASEKGLEILVGGMKIEKASSVKYLGLTIDNRLKWDEHINNQVAACRKLMFCLKGFIGKTWGPSPEMVKYAYTSCVRAKLAYSAFAFARSLTKGQISKMEKLQRMAMMMTCNMRKGTPTSALEVILDIPPIDLFLKSEAKKAGYRLIGTSDDEPAKGGHIEKGS